jgi:2-aminoethylphosphonate-pyruvate transaminase
MESLARATDVVHDDILLVESDIVYEQRAMSLLLEHPAKDVVLASGPTMAGDEVFVKTAGTRVTGVSKSFSGNEPSIAGEFVGLCKMSHALVQEMCARAAARGTRSIAYELDTLPECLSVFDVQCLSVSDLVWGEIDDWKQWDHVRRVVMPRLRDAENRLRTRRPGARGSAQDPPCYAC